MTDKEKTHQILSSLWKNDDSVGKTYYNQALQDVQTAIDLREEPVSTKDKLLALSDGRLHLGWIDDAKVVEFEECLMQFYEDMNNIPKGTDSQTRLKDADGVMHSYSKKLMFMAKEEPVSKDLEEASKEWLIPQLDKSYANYGEVKMMELTHFDGYAMLDAIEFGAKWQKENLWKPADGDDLPEIDMEVIALLDNGKVVFAHRPPEYWDGKNIVTGKVTRHYPKTYDKGGWNIPDVKFWLDVELPKEIEL